MDIEQRPFPPEGLLRFPSVVTRDITNLISCHWTYTWGLFVLRGALSCIRSRLELAINLFNSSSLDIQITYRAITYYLRPSQLQHRVCFRFRSTRTPQRTSSQLPSRCPLLTVHPLPVPARGLLQCPPDQIPIFLHPTRLLPVKTDCRYRRWQSTATKKLRTRIGMI